MFGKNEDNIFNMDISHPLNAFIAFAIILPFFWNKIIYSILFTYFK